MTEEFIVREYEKYINDCIIKDHMTEAMIVSCYRNNLDKSYMRCNRNDFMEYMECNNINNSSHNHIVKEKTEQELMDEEWAEACALFNLTEPL